MKIRYAALIPLAFAIGCSNEQPETAGDDSLNKDTVAAVVEVPESESSLPSPLLVASMFKRSGLKYLPGQTNPVNNASKYNSTFSLAQNMGAYSADMAYCVLNKQTNEASQLLKTIREIGTKINLGKVFEQTDLYERFNKNIDSEDSLRDIIVKIQYETDNQLELNQQNQYYGVIFAGAWVEAMYIGGQVYRRDGNDNVVQALLQQMAVCESIITELKAHESEDPGITGLITDLTSIQVAIDAMPAMKKWSENPDLEFSDVKPDKTELEPVIQKIEELRKKIVNG